MSATYSVIMDWRTGAITYRGTNGRIYTEAELAAAEAGAERGDEDAMATLAAIKRPAPTSREDAQRMLEAEMADCELCREARAHGEQPVMLSHHGGIDGWFPSSSREIAERPPNWWHGRKPRRARGRR